MKKVLSVEEQVAKIKDIMSKKRVIPDYRFTFGRHKGELLEKVYRIDKKYLAWLYHNNESIPYTLTTFIEDHVL